MNFCAKNFKFWHSRCFIFIVAMANQPSRNRSLVVSFLLVEVPESEDSVLCKFYF